MVCSMKTILTIIIVITTNYVQKLTIFYPGYFNNWSQLIYFEWGGEGPVNR